MTERLLTHWGSTHAYHLPFFLLGRLSLTDPRLSTLAQYLVGCYGVGHTFRVGAGGALGTGPISDMWPLQATRSPWCIRSGSTSSSVRLVWELVRGTVAFRFLFASQSTATTLSRDSFDGRFPDALLRGVNAHVCPPVGTPIISYFEFRPMVGETGE